MKMARKGDEICARKYVNVSKLLVPLAQAVNADPDPLFVTVMNHIFFLQFENFNIADFRITIGIWLVEH
jgi:lipoprotein signal peptidase